MQSMALADNAHVLKVGVLEGGAVAVERELSALLRLHDACRLQLRLLCQRWLQAGCGGRGGDHEAVLDHSAYLHAAPRGRPLHQVRTRPKQVARGEAPTFRTAAARASLANMHIPASKQTSKQLVQESSRIGTLVRIMLGYSHAYLCPRTLQYALLASPLLGSTCTGREKDDTCPMTPALL